MGQASYDFEDETVVVTGGSSGIGRAIALAFAEAGATVVNADVQPDPSDPDAELPTHERIAEDGGRAEYVETDVADPDQLVDVVDAARELGGVDVMVNNAGILIWRDLLEVSEEEFDRIHGVNVRGVFFGTQAAALDMIDREDPGVIVNTASISAHLGLHKESAYVSTKGAVRMITRGAALELADYDVRVNAIAPGHVATTLSGTPVEAKEKAVENEEIIKPIPLGRIAYPTDVAGAALYLASENASYVTGELLYIDGGYRLY